MHKSVHCTKALTQLITFDFLEKENALCIVLIPMGRMRLELPFGRI